MTKIPSIKLFILLLIAICSFSSESFAQAMQFENQVIEKIDVVVENLPSESNFDKRSVLSRMKTRTGDIFSHVDFDNDLKILAREFDRVVPTMEFINGKIFITLRIWPKPVIRSIEWVGNCELKKTRLRKELGINVLTLFDRQCFNKAFHKLKNYYVKNGFFEAELDYSVTLDPLTNEVDIVININEGRAGKIRKIRFSGFSSDEEECILELMHTKKYNSFTSWITHEGTFHEDAIQQDHFVILNYIQNEGYADAKVDIKVMETPRCNRIDLLITLDRGPQFFFGEICLEGNTLLSTADLMKHFRITPGAPYSPDKIRDTIRRIQEHYGRWGYIDAAVDFEPDLNPECRTYNIKLTVEEGQQWRVGMLKVFGNCSTQTRVILHETLLIPGEIFNSDKLQRTEERLRNIGYFKHVNVYAVKSDGPCGLGGNFRDVHIEVEETNTGYFSASGGFSSAENLFFGLNISEKNFNIRGVPCLRSEGFRALRGGGEYFHMNATFGTKSRKYEIGWTQPYFRDTQWIVGVDLENSCNRYISHEYDINASMLTLHATYEFNPFVRVGWHYRLRYSDLDLHTKKCEENDKLPEGSKEHKKWMEVKAEREENISKLKKQAKHEGLVSAVGTTLTYDATDSASCPTKGFRSRLGVEVAGIGGKHSFFGLSYVNSYYYPIQPKAVLKFRTEARFIVPYGETNTKEVPIDERLFLGGDTQVRGYRQYRLGPQLGKDDPTGGLSMQFLSLEYDRKIASRVNAFLFFDGGCLTSRVFHFGRLNMSAGYGVRVKVMDSIPAIILGMGYPINARCRSDVKKFFFQMGGRF